MATFTGQDGALFIQGVAVAEVRSFSIDMTNNTVERTVMGDDWKSHYSTQKEWSGSADIYYNQVSGGTTANVSGISSITVGNSAAFIGYPAGNSATSGSPKIAGSIIVTGLSVSTSLDGMVEGTISFTGNGAMTLTDATGS
jgi:predicted secreted protein